MVTVNLQPEFIVSVTPENDSISTVDSSGTIIKGDKGDKGDPFRILGFYSEYSTLEQAVKNPVAGDAYAIGKTAPYELYIWDGVSGNWMNFGIVKGEDGATFIPMVTEQGVISWTNNKGLDNPHPQNIKGNDGATPSFEIRNGHLYAIYSK